MAQKESGPYSILSLSWFYAGTQYLADTRSVWRYVVERRIRPASGQVILDVGCGTGGIVDHLPAGVRYIGIDLSERYIAAARRRWNGRAEFLVGTAEDLPRTGIPRADFVVLTGVLHHLDDRAATRMFTAAAEILAPHGRVVTTDCVLFEGQHAVSRFLITHDRGRNVRTEAEYGDLARPTFAHVETSVERIRRIPYDDIVMVCHR